MIVLQPGGSPGKVSGEKQGEAVREAPLRDWTPRAARRFPRSLHHPGPLLPASRCKHIANAATRGIIEETCRGAGYEPPTICTPEELTED